MVMSFFKKSAHSFLAQSNSLTNIDTNPNETHSPNSFPCGLGLISAMASGAHKTTNVLESTTVKSLPLSSSLSSSILSSFSPLSLSSSLSSSDDVLRKKDRGGIGFLDDVGGGVDGLMSCTESLGFESSDERGVDDEIELRANDSISTRNVAKWKRSVDERSREVKKFPPPLSSFNHNGQPSFFLRPVRREGRLELIEVRIDRPEILRASREDGRLRLHLVRHDDCEEEDDEDEDEFNIDEKDFEKKIVEEKKEGEIDDKKTINISLVIDDKEVEGQAMSECNKFNKDDEVTVNQAHHQSDNNYYQYHRYYYNHHSSYKNNHMHVWSQQCVTTR